MKKIEQAIEHLEAAVNASLSRPHTNGYMRGLTEGLQQALNACREIATGEHHDYLTAPPPADIATDVSRYWIVNWEAGDNSVAMRTSRGNLKTVNY